MLTESDVANGIRRSKNKFNIHSLNFKNVTTYSLNFAQCQQSITLLHHHLILKHRLYHRLILKHIKRFLYAFEITYFSNQKPKTKLMIQIIKAIDANQK